MKNATLLVLACAIAAGCTASLDKSPTERAAPDQDKVYIPKDLDDCLAQLQKLLKPENIEKMKGGTEDDMIQYHMGLGMWMRNNWGLWGGSRLAKWFNAHGIKHPDDMSGVILDSYWRHLNKKRIKLDEQVKHYQDYWKKQKIQSGASSDKQ